MQETQGNIADIELPRLLHNIYKEADPASFLDIVREPIKKRFFFKNGMPVYATSNVLGEVLGRLLMTEGIISQKDYENSLEIVLKEKRRHGEVLTSMGLITTEELDNFLALQLKRRLWRIFDWKDGTFEYKKIDKLPGPISPIPLHPAELILNGISLGFYPLPHIKESLQNQLDAIAAPALERSGYRLEDFKLNLQETRFFKSFDGKKSLREILEGSDLLRQRALSLALSFIITGIIKTGSDALADQTSEEEPVAVEADTSGMDSRLSAELLFMKAKTAIEGDDYSGAAVTLREITELNPVEGEYWAWLGWAIFNSEDSRAGEAESIIKDSLDLNNEIDIAWYFLARVFTAQNNREAALAAFRTAVEKNPWMLDAVAEIKCLELNEALKDAPRRYMEVYKFGLDPFSPGPIGCSFTPTASQEEALELLERTIKKRSGPLLLEGGAGVGKTAAGIELLKRLSNKKVLAALIIDPPDKELELIRSINTELGATTESSSIKEQLLSLGMRVSQNKTLGGHTIIIIDRAEVLTDGCLKLIQYLARLKTIQLVLIAGPELKTRLQEPGFAELSEKLIARFSLNPFSEEEALSFLSSRIALAVKGAGAGAKTLSFSPEELTALYTEGSGVASAMLTLGAKRAEEKAGTAGSSGEPEEPEEIEAVEASTETTIEAKAPPELPVEIPEELSMETIEADEDSLSIGEQNTDLSALDTPAKEEPAPPSDEPDELDGLVNLSANITDMAETTATDEDAGREPDEPDQEVSLEVTSLLDSLIEESSEAEPPPAPAPTKEPAAPETDNTNRLESEEMGEFPTPPATKGGIKPTTGRLKQNRRSSIVTLMIWFIITLILGLGAGAFFGIYLNR